MKNNKLLLLIAAVVFIGCLAVIYFFFPSLQNKNRNLSANSTQSANLSAVASKPSPASSVASESAARKLTKPASGPDFNAIVYASAPRTITNPATEPLASGMGVDTVLEDPKSDMSRKPIDPQKDPANQLINVNH